MTTGILRVSNDSVGVYVFMRHPELKSVAGSQPAEQLHIEIGEATPSVSVEATLYGRIDRADDQSVAEYFGQRVAAARSGETVWMLHSLEPQDAHVFDLMSNHILIGSLRRVFGRRCELYDALGNHLETIAVGEDSSHDWQPCDETAAALAVTRLEAHID